jgi:hypothetical protein
MGAFWSKLVQSKWWQGLAGMQRGEVKCLGSREGPGLDQVQPENQYGLKFGWCTQGVCEYGRMRKVFKF